MTMTELERVQTQIYAAHRAISVINNAEDLVHAREEMEGELAGLRFAEKTLLRRRFRRAAVKEEGSQ